MPTPTPTPTLTTSLPTTTTPAPPGETLCYLTSKVRVLRMNLPIWILAAIILFFLAIIILLFNVLISYEERLERSESALTLREKALTLANKSHSGQAASLNQAPAQALSNLEDLHAAIYQRDALRMRALVSDAEDQASYRALCPAFQEGYPAAMRRVHFKLTIEFAGRYGVLPSSVEKDAEGKCRPLPTFRPDYFSVLSHRR
ncbi:hypothetical protein DSL72_007075 [Monilinia vaccinii-corymbosi]|uniref:Uncharacterized protein n=1 Tax=Monilinia vaccinii-corymbosi TaxID=61207 RepID=A0A8A3PLS3_9HELO|nr:hypothetical protein DSL72_007075 [Monilinia vaccinii-corymbosi]